MKRILSTFILLTLLCCAQGLYAQENEPRFPGCDDKEDMDCADMKMMQFVFSNLRPPEGNPGGEVTAAFVVKASGKIDNITITSSLTPGCDEEVIRILNLMPNWLPAIIDGVAVDMEWELIVKIIAK